MFERSQVKEGMVVRSQDGEKLGRVFSVGEDSFHIEKGLFFPKDYRVQLSEVAGVRDGELVLAHGRDSLRALSLEQKEARPGAGDAGYLAGTGGGAGVGPGAVGIGDTGVSASTAATTGAWDSRDTAREATPLPGMALGATGMTASAGSIGTDLGRDSLDTGRVDERRSDTLGAGAGFGVGTGEGRGFEREAARSGTQRTVGDNDREIAVPVAREELDVVKREREAGQVRITKEVVSEEQEVSVPVRKERVRVERRNVEPGRPAMSASFKDETIVVPLREEQVEVEKRALIKEEVVVHKDAIEEERRVAETVRREQVDVRTEGDVEDADRTRSGFRAPDDDPLKRY
ncbi:DUF2382 domain-containing protein [Aggregicoccus sp. 17bor-14]|uniref:YsnF/AvaK domain-containing protein n=1 Tax=Myxococcaceae TaxID=31 RepID=UPI00129CC297|nr:MULTISPECIES: YsnF/AvaK domain-containing protein [Myxococcaceae]MBF5041766.1 YsnF/AvaK domain-containing protein [Simulacricoccus sp. 17bor-14]MRI87547.1 DUF2382 domain-containing protein [Aggregicoccus sp. 17bor-14]